MPDTIELRDFYEFFQAQRPKIVRMVRGILGPHVIDGVDAEDIAQQALVTVWTKWQRIGRIAAPDAYLFTVAQNLARRAITRRSIALSDERIAAALDPEPGPESNLTRLVLERAIKSLAPRQAEVVTLELEGLSDPDIAAALNITTDSVRSNRRHAKIALRNTATALHD
ncbi:RNA polymerase sigma factor [Streptomyces vinaceus]|uniref:RNA polymerase sigma factor n=1 Tax=Streptomyces vinaceus TaxID=1960 RepID=UPI0035DA2489